MIRIPGYKVEDLLYESSRTKVFSGFRNSDKRRVVFKTLIDHHPSTEDIARLNGEYKIINELKIPEIVRPVGLESHKGRPVIILENFEGKSLDFILKHLEENPLELEEALNLAIKITELLGKIHEQHVIHKDLVPSNIMVNRETGDVRIIDFGISTRFSRQELAAINPNRLEGTLPYISPEQTGRMNRPLDYRTDFYSLGITFYRMFTGELPFRSTDPLELIHFHIARAPEQCHEKKPGVPAVLSSIVAKLIAKSPEDRYQSTYGIKTDLQRCLDDFERGTLETFDIAKHDLYENFRVSEKLYGRDEEISNLIDAFHSIAGGGKQMIFFSGSPGIGKSSLINEIHKPIVEKRGYFCSGKYDQYQRSIPYSGIIQAFQGLLRQLLTGSESELARLKNDILEAVGNSGQIIIDVIHEVELVTGVQPEVPELPPVDAQNRFNTVFQNFVKIFAHEDHPLVLFLDDLQWVDSASMEMIRLLVEDDDLSYFLFIGAFREKEVDKSHPFPLMLEKLAKNNYSWSDVPVGPLQESHIASMIGDTFYCSLENARELASLLLQKTGGNPFFLKEYLKTLYERGLIQFQRDGEGESKWKWDIESIKQAGITDNVVELMAEKVKRLPNATWNVLKTACCMGTAMDVGTLAAACGLAGEEVTDVLSEAIDEGILLIIGSRLKFVHDRVWEGAYSLIEDKERKALHYTIGKKIVEEAGEPVPEDLVFGIADQWNRAGDLLNGDEQKQLRGINYKAGKKARASTAYAAAVSFFRQGAEILPDACWKEDYYFTLKYHKQWAIAEYLDRNFTEAERLFELILQNARDVMEKVEIYSIQIDHYITQSRFHESLDVGVKAVNALGIKLARVPSKGAIVKELLKSKMAARKRKIEDWINQPNLTDKKIIAAMEIMEKCMPGAVVAGPTLAPVFSLKMVNLTFKHGNGPISPWAYIMYAVINVGPVGDIETGFRFGELAVKLVEKIESSSMRSKVYFIFGYMINLAKKGYRDAADYFSLVREHSMESGNFLYLGYSYSNYGYMLLYAGDNLDSVCTNFYAKYLRNVVKLNQPHNTDMYNLWYQAALNMKGESEDFLTLTGSAMNEEELLAQFEETKDNTGFAEFYHIKQYLTYLAGEFALGIEYSEKLLKLTDNLLGKVSIPVLHFLYGLLLAAVIPDAEPGAQKGYIKLLKVMVKKFKKWGDHNKFNHLHRYFLLAAELNRFTGGSMEETAGFYSDAIQLAHANDNLAEEAISNERASLYFLSAKQEKMAAFYMSEAYYYYKRWGCQPKVRSLEEEYPHLVDLKRRRMSLKGLGEITVSTSTTTSGATSLDLGTILKASNTISREIRLGRLLKKMMDIVIENAGAEKGYFLLRRDGEWYVEAEGSVNKNEISILQSIPVKSEDESGSWARLSRNIIKYVERTGEIVVLNDAVHKGSFTQDDYIRKQKPRSVLCLPLLNQGKLAGILYLENNLTTDAFTEERQTVLEMLSSQIAISIENARMYRDVDELNKNLEQKVQERTRELKEKNEQILDSIRYSKRIQDAILPVEERLTHVFPQHFIIYMPRDIVSGDFYWFSQLQNDIFMAVADCTGHGVPGALLAMMGDIFLNEIVNTNRILEPARILEELHKRVRTHLKQDDAAAETMDGMDVCLCRIERDNNKLVYAGAKRPLYIVKAKNSKKSRSEYKLNIVRGDRKPIGGRQKEINRVYTDHEVDINKGDMVYFTSDGFIDQPAPDMKKYGSKRFEAFLAMAARFPVEVQKRYMMEELQSYMDTEKQRDDITILGIRL